MKPRDCDSPRHAYQCTRCGLRTNGVEDSAGRVHAYDRKGNCTVCPPRPSICPPDAPCLTETTTPKEV